MTEYNLYKKIIKNINSNINKTAIINDNGDKISYFELKKSTENLSAGSLFSFLSNTMGLFTIYERGDEKIKPLDSIAAILSQLSFSNITDI